MRVDLKGLLQVVSGQHLGGCAQCQQPAFVQQAQPVAVTGGKGQIVDRQHDRPPAPGVAAQQAQHVLLLEQVEAGDRLVGQYHPGLAGQYPGQPDPGLLATGELVYVAVQPGIHAGCRGGLGDGVGVVVAPGQAPKADYIAHGQSPGAGAALRQKAQLLRALALGDGSDRRPGQVYFALMILNPCQTVQQGGLACTVGAYDAKHFSGFQVQVDVHQPLADAQVLNADQIHRLRSFHTSQMNSGAPSREVSTPSFSSRPGGNRRTPISARQTRMAPASAAGINKRSGRCCTSGRRICGTSRPTKPILPATATDEPTSMAAPSTSMMLP